MVANGPRGVIGMNCRFTMMFGGFGIGSVRCINKILISEEPLEVLGHTEVDSYDNSFGLKGF